MRISPTRAQVMIAALALAAVALVVLSLRSPELPVFPPSPILDADADRGGGNSSGAQLLTVDASDPQSWRHIDLERGTVVEAPGPDGWDLAFRRFEVRVNGGAGGQAGAGVLALGDVALDSVRSVPASGYVGMSARGRDTTHALLDEWYSYSFTSHVLRPAARVYAVRTARGLHAALEFVSYYCPGAQPGCVTVRYRFVDPSES
ncbi:MAG: HmuY family protein [Gemmatimonadota bacterium]|nr:HmuY family protein [Gemmatimonadota bacterium]